MNSSKYNENRPYVISSAATTLDGQIATFEGDTTLSNPKDWTRVHQLRSENDAIMVGGGTIREDDSKLTVDIKKLGYQPNRHPVRVVVSANGNIPIDARVITFQPEIPTLIAVTSKCSFQKREKLKDAGCEILLCGQGKLVDLSQLLRMLKTKFKINKLMLEGGSKLNGEMLSNKLIDEIQLSIAPVVAGKGTPLFTFSKPIPQLSKSPFFDIVSFNKIGDMLWVRMIVRYRPRALL